MAPGNWATDRAGGSAFGYALLSVIPLSNLMAILLQSLSARLGIVTGRDLAQACRDHYSKPVAISLWLLCEIAICACDLAEVLGSAIALKLLFHIPLLAGVCITALDVLAVMFLQNKGFRYIEALVVILILTIGGCFLAEIIFSKPSLGGILGGFVPDPEILRNKEMLYIALRPWLRRLITRLIAIVPAIICLAIFGDAATDKLLVLSQVILSMQLPFAIVPLVLFTSERAKMGEFANKLWVKVLAWFTTIVIIVLNVKLLADAFGLTDAVMTWL